MQIKCEGSPLTDSAVGYAMRAYAPKWYGALFGSECNVAYVRRVRPTNSKQDLMRHLPPRLLKKGNCLSLSWIVLRYRLIF